MVADGDCSEAVALRVDDQSRVITEWSSGSVFGEARASSGRTAAVRTAARAEDGAVGDSGCGAEWIDPVLGTGSDQCWAPDQISGVQRTRRPTQPEQHVSASTIDRWIALQGSQRTHWRQFLRRRGRRPYHPRKLAKQRAKPIRDRPPIIERRERLGDFEGDLVLGQPGTGGLLTVVDRRSRFICLEKVHDKTARHVHEKFRQALSKLPADKRHSTTFDNGTEFARCHLVEKTHGTKRYFADPGCPHQRSTNENTNGRLRQFFPKGSDFRTITWADIRRVETLMNNRPRKCVGYRTPAEVFLELSTGATCN